MVTLKQVAELAEVSPTTASYALNHRPEVKEETRRKVIEAARKLNYVPNKVAQNFRNKKTNTITVVTGENIESGNTFSAEFFGILAGAREHHYDVLVKLVGKEYLNQSEISYLLGNKLSDGYLLLGNKLDLIAEYIVENSLNGVLLSSHSDLAISQVNVDGRKWIRKMVDYAFEKGRVKPAYLTYMDRTKEEILRAAGFCDALVCRGMEPKGAIYSCGYHSEDLESAVDSCIRDHNDILICWNDILALQVIGILRKRKKEIPKDIAVTGFDDNILYGSLIGELTTIHQPFLEKGKSAIELLIREIEGKNQAPRKINLDCFIVSRNSL